MSFLEKALAFFKDNLIYIGIVLAIFFVLLVAIIAINRAKKRKQAKTIATSDFIQPEAYENAIKVKVNKLEPLPERIKKVAVIPPAEPKAEEPKIFDEIGDILENNCPMDTDENVQDDTAENKRFGKVEIYMDKAGKFRFRVKASNASTIAHSQSYTTKSGCKSGINAVKNMLDAPIVDNSKGDVVMQRLGKAIVEIYKDSDSKFRFRFKSSNLNNILASQGYTSKENCFNGVNSVRRFIPDAIIVDNTLIKNL